MPYMSGLLEGFNAARENRYAQNQKADQAKREQEANLYKYLLASTDPEIQSLALSGLFESATPGSKAKGLGGFMGEVQGGTIYPQLKALMGQEVPNEAPAQPFSPEQLGSTPTATATGTPPAPPAKPGSGALPATSLVEPHAHAMQQGPPTPPPFDGADATAGVPQQASGTMAPPPMPAVSQFKRRGTGVPTAEEIADAAERRKIQAEAAKEAEETRRQILLKQTPGPPAFEALPANSPGVLDKGRGVIIPSGIAPATKLPPGPAGEAIVEALMGLGVSDVEHATPTQMVAALPGAQKILHDKAANTDALQQSLLEMRSFSAQLAQDRVNDLPTAADLQSQAQSISLGGQPFSYLSKGSFSGTAAQQHAAKLAAGTGVQILDPKEVTQVNAANSTLRNLDSYFTQIKDKLTPSAAGRPRQALVNKAKSFFQTDADLAAAKSWELSVIPMLRALGDSGRIPNQQIELAIASRPTVTDDLPTAQGKMQVIRSIVENGIRPLLERGQPAAPPNAPPALVRPPRPGTRSAVSAAPPANPAAPPAGGSIVVTAPDGTQHPFQTQAQADQFKQLAGIP